MRRRTAMFASLLLGLTSGCPDELEAPQPSSIDRPGDLAFSCFDRTTGAYRPLADCETNGEEAPEDLSLTVFVTQTARGEVGAVDVTEGRVLDTEVRVPGFTFRRVGESPLAIATSRQTPNLSYVANYGSQTVQSVPNDELRPDATDSGEAPSIVGLPSGPTDLVLTPDDDFLYVTVPATGEVFEIPIETNDEGLTVLGTPMAIALAAAIPERVSPEPPSADDIKVCPADRTLEQAAAGSTADRMLGTQPTPVAAVLDEARGRMFVADAALPLIHLIDLADGGATVAGAINVGSPVLAMAITPVVPEALSSTSGSEQFLYAIDAVDHSVMVVDISDEDAATYGTVLNVSTDPSRPDRLVFGGVPAKSIEVMSPGFPGDACIVSDANGLTDDAIAAGPGRLRGVFVAVGLLNGSVVIVDVHDLDAPCRGGQDCANPPNSIDTVVYIQRHRPRVGTVIVNEIGVRTTPSFTFNGRPGRVDAEGTTTNLASGLTPENGCPATMVQAFPETEEGLPLICANANPWEARNETWTATWEGVIPGTSTNVGTFDPANEDRFVASQPQFCSRGVLGSNNVPSDDPLGGYVGDQLVITSSIPEDAPEECFEAEFFGPQPTGGLPFVAFAIEESFPGHLIVGAPLGDRDLAAVRHCFIQPTGFEVRTQEAFTIVGTSNGFRHRVIDQGEDEACVLDSTLPTEQIGRAFEAETYDNSFVRFTIAAFDETLDPEEGTALSFSISDVPPSFGIALSNFFRNAVVPVLPAALRYSPIDENLYIVDVSTLGLLQTEGATLQVLRQFD